MSRSATRIFHSAVRAWPSSSMVRATTAAPCSRTIGITLAKRLSRPTPFSKFTELITARPPRHSSPASITGGSVESNMIGSVLAVASREAASRMSTAPSRPDVVDAQVDQVGALAHRLAADVDDPSPSRRRAWRLGTPWSRWIWCARRP